MRAMVLEEPAAAETHPLHCRDLSPPKPAPGEVLLQVLACGVCRTDLHIVEGEVPLPNLPLIPGHQVVGKVIAVGEQVPKELLGRTVGVGWMAQTCGRCSYCMSSRENLCPQAQFTGLHRTGGYADFMTVRADFTYPLPPGLSPEHAAPLLCAGIIGYRALRLAGALEPVPVGFWGFGASAHLALQVARHAGAQVYVFTRSAQHQQHAKELGACWAGRPEDAPGVELQAAVIFSPAGEQVPLALRQVAAGATVACAGITMSDLPKMAYELLYRERRLLSVTNATRQDAQQLLQLAQEIPLRTDVEPMELREANAALLRVKHSQVKGALVLTP